MEAGVGPVCRKRNNHLFAKHIPINLPMASLTFLREDALNGLEDHCKTRFLHARDTFVKKSAKMQKRNDDITKFILTGEDFRDEIETLDYLLSYQLPLGTRKILINIIRYLGYVGLAAVIQGQASKSPAKVYFKDGRVFLEGTSCRAGWKKMQKIRGIRTPKYRGSKEPYSAPARAASVFCNIIMEHWPLFDSDLKEVKKLAKEWVVKNKNTPLTAEDVSANIKLRTEDFLLSFTWKNDVNVQEMLSILKQVPAKERRYDPATKKWVFLMKHLGFVQKNVTKFYQDLIILDGPTEATPESFWSKPMKYSSRSTARSRRYVR